ncbi:MAG: tRNA 2-thiouridine(34) synthase MnmA [Desulfovibrionaceae bacterium]|nr:tRNA 2-thiouridine(34) synthase MnmA [Desulfovibrionaceae bacterium]
MTIAVAVSGGVDSLYALLSLKGVFGGPVHDVIALHARFRDESLKDPVPGLAERCRDFGIPFHVLDLRRVFDEKVVHPFMNAYVHGRTPNPCALCNRHMKFGQLLDAAEQLGADRLATGHYADVVEHPVYGSVLRSGKDVKKDQSYFLGLVPRERVRKLLFPLAHLTKAQIRSIMADHGIAVPLSQESQEICFVPNDDYRAFLTASGVSLPGGGPMVLADGHVIGKHKGLWQYTEGQRRGLGIAWSEPLYVIGKDRSRNALILGDARSLATRSCVASHLNLFVPSNLWPNELFVRVRYRQKAVPAEVRIVGSDEDATRMLIRFETPQIPTAPGQLAVVFDADGCLLAGGILCKDN